MTKSKRFLVVDAPEYVERKLAQQFNKSDDYGKFNFLITLKKSDSTDDSGRSFYTVELYEQTDYHLIDGDDVQEIADFCKKFENVGIFPLF